MTPNEIKLYYGGLLKFHRQTGIPASTLMGWLRRGYVPFEEQCKIQHLTNGGLRVISIEQPKTYKTDNKKEWENENEDE